MTLTFEEQKVLKELKYSLIGLLGPSLTGLFIYGSKARGDDDSKSDIDIAIIVRGLTGKLKDDILTRVAEIEFQYCISLSTLVLSEKEFGRLKKRQRRLALDIEKEGISI